MINKDSIVRFSMRRPDLRSFELLSRNEYVGDETQDEFTVVEQYTGYFGHEVRQYQEGIITVAVEATFIVEDQEVLPKAMDKIVDNGGITWTIPEGTDVNVLGSIVKFACVKEVGNGN